MSKDGISAERGAQIAKALLDAKSSDEESAIHEANEDLSFDDWVEVGLMEFALSRKRRKG